MKFAKISEYDDIVKLSANKTQKLLENWVIDLAKRDLKANTIRAKLVPKLCKFH
ncbi:MAG: hypothetical protein OEQ94_06820 [Nitrosopumilus sp.]|nr:hypothetical protein [Nitrosopumilus sp.]